MAGVCPPLVRVYVSFVFNKLTSTVPAGYVSVRAWQRLAGTGRVDHHQYFLCVQYSGPGKQPRTGGVVPLIDVAAQRQRGYNRRKLFNWATHWNRGWVILKLSAPGELSDCTVPPGPSFHSPANMSSRGQSGPLNQCRPIVCRHRKSGLVMSRSLSLSLSPGISRARSGTSEIASPLRPCSLSGRSQSSLDQVSLDPASAWRSRRTELTRASNFDPWLFTGPTSMSHPGVHPRNGIELPSKVHRMCTLRSSWRHHGDAGAPPISETLDRRRMVMS